MVQETRRAKEGEVSEKGLHARLDVMVEWLKVLEIRVQALEQIVVDEFGEKRLEAVANAKADAFDDEARKQLRELWPQ